MSEAQEQKRLKGIVKWFNNAKGYGFLGRDGGAPDVFVHRGRIHLRGLFFRTPSNLLQCGGGPYIIAN